MKSSFYKGASAAIALGCVSVSAPVLAQAEQVDIAADDDWEHAWTDMAFPAQIGAFEREAVTKFEERETNISARYFDTDSQTILSLYIYRPGNPSPAIWFDRALMAIGVTEAYGTVDLDDMKIGTFTPAGGTIDSGQFAVLAVDGNFRSTGVALYRAGEWLVKVRISSRELSVTRMDEMLRASLERLPALSGVDTRPVQFVTECENALEYGPAQAVASDLGMLAIGQAVAVTAEQNVKMRGTSDEDAAELGIEDRGSLDYCREGRRKREFNIYRPVETENRYTVGVGDAGFSIEVYPDLVGTEIDSDGSGDTVYTVRSASGLDVKLHTPFRGFPNLGQVSQSAMRGPTIASINRPLAGDDERRISINPDLP